MKQYSFAFLFVFIVNSVFSLSQAQVEIIGDDDVQFRLRMRIASSDTLKNNGYRIQLFFGNDRHEAQKIQAEFNARYSDWSDESYLLYYDPNWKFRVGNFYRKIDAQPLMKELLHDFGNVFLIRDQIELPALRFED
jgi:SPOR domain